MTDDNGDIGAPDDGSGSTRDGGGGDISASTVPPVGGRNNEPELITTIYMSRLKDVFEAMRAADTLGLGVKVHNRWVEEDDDSAFGEWIVDLFTDAVHVGG